MTQNWPAFVFELQEKGMNLASRCSCGATSGFVTIPRNSKSVIVICVNMIRDDMVRDDTAVTSWFCERTQSAACSSQMEHGDELHQPSQSSSCAVPACPAWNITNASVKEEWARIITFYIF